MFRLIQTLTCWQDVTQGHFLSCLIKAKKSNLKEVVVVEGDQKAPFSITTTPSCSGGHYSFLWIAPFYPWYVPNITKS